MIKLSGTWHVPDGTPTEANDQHYFDVHVPNVRRLPKLLRHVVLKATPFPDDTHTRCWRGAEIWFDSQAEEAAVTVDRATRSRLDRRSRLCSVALDCVGQHRPFSRTRAVHSRQVAHGRRPLLLGIPGMPRHKMMVGITAWQQQALCRRISFNIPPASCHGQ